VDSLSSFLVVNVLKSAKMVDIITGNGKQKGIPRKQRATENRRVGKCEKSIALYCLYNLDDIVNSIQERP
jgi:hypothetical protein